MCFISFLGKSVWGRAGSATMSQGTRVLCWGHTTHRGTQRFSAQRTLACWGFLLASYLFGTWQCSSFERFTCKYVTISDCH